MSGAEEKDPLVFKGKMVNGTLDLNTVQMVCVPSKPHYAEVDLCLKDGWSFVVAEVVGNSLSFEEKKKLGYEIEKRWNAYKNAPQNTIEGVALQPATVSSKSWTAAINAMESNLKTAGRPSQPGHLQQLKQAIALVRQEAFLINHKPGGTLDLYLENIEQANCLR